MHIILVEKNERLLDKYSPLIEGQFPGVAEKIRQHNRGAQLLPDWLSRRAQKGWSLLRPSTIYCIFCCHIPLLLPCDSGHDMTIPHIAGRYAVAAVVCGIPAAAGVLDRKNHT
jgi:hypothetical protein